MSELWVRKMRTHFNLLDFDHDGVLSDKDFDLIAIHYAEYFKADPKKAERLLKAIRDMWSKWAETAEGDGKQNLTVSLFIESMKRQRQNPEEYKKVANELLRAFFDILDVNKDGYLQEDEHQRLFAAHGIPDTSFAKVAFDAIDLNHDGKLSFQEFTISYFEFMFTDDENNPSNLHFGPLV